ncbi:hypothetical protein AF72_11370 [Xylella taiwanensis]|uniref:Uncharacterized protein n=1 Tax=Xylella taiwanensis TaxID=1444770 RepID=Z9JG36_9GAMM|nr:hypothetical protein AF72_11370 [Xylella taiwanensis]
MVCITESTWVVHILERLNRDQDNIQYMAMQMVPKQPPIQGNARGLIVQSIVELREW